MTAAELIGHILVLTKGDLTKEVLAGEYVMYYPIYSVSTLGGGSEITLSYDTNYEY